MFSVEINYKKGPSFSTTLDAASVEHAKSAAIEYAKSMRFNEKIKGIRKTVWKQQSERCIINMHKSE